MGTHVVHAALTTSYVTNLIRFKACQLSRRPGFRRAEQRDLEQELAAAVLKQAHHYDPARAAVNTFIDRVVTSAAAMIVRARGRLKRGSRVRAQSLEGTTVPNDGEETPIGELLTAEDRLRHQGITFDEDDARPASSEMSAALGSLPQQLRHVCQRLMEGETETSVARELGISRRQMRKVMDELREALSRAGLGDS